MARDLSIIDIARCLPARAPDSHKGSFGHVVVAAGSRGMTGAALLACHAALRSGPGLVTLAVPDPLVAPLAPALLEAMTLPLPSTPAGAFDCEAAEPLLAFMGTRQVLVLGPGIGQDAATVAFVLAILRGCVAPVVLDADGLNAIAVDSVSALRDNPGPRLLTPHPGEMARLMHCDTGTVQRDREGAAADFAESHGCTVCLKGAGTIVASPGEVPFRNATGNPGMATGGTGDVLAGILGGMLAQGLPPLDAAKVAVFVHGLAGDLAAEKYTQRGMIARDVIAALPEAWHLIEGAA